jgi:hypothetical protein
MGEEGLIDGGHVSWLAGSQRPPDSTERELRSHIHISAVFKLGTFLVIIGDAVGAVPMVVGAGSPVVCGGRSGNNAALRTTLRPALCPRPRTSHHYR